MNETLPDIDFEALFDEDVPCGGAFSRLGVKCPSGAPAQLRSLTHGHGMSFKCSPCWQKWYTHNADILAAKGWLTCVHCGGQFGSVEEFSDFRAF